ncbi:DUF6090 family protein [Winogradskyella sp. A3E31]|uniref:DUF6090 family protein n=1 Tax=Winogradskyella sp. A3E31 TaxID=3349637 RepID=UPI00398B8DC3
MIKFFRNVRKRLLSEGKTSPNDSVGRAGKYFKYAIGEIILVVIGILIALSINNWNEEKKLKKEEQKLIAAITKEIESNIEKLEEALSVNKLCAERSNSIIKEGSSNSNFETKASDIIGLFCYTGNRIDNSILNEILGTNSRALISDDKHLDQLRVLKLNYDRLEKTMNYVDAYWNGTAIDFFNSSGVGIYMQQKTINTAEKFIPDSQFYSVISIMNGFQNSLIRSQEDLDQALKNTFELLNY